MNNQSNSKKRDQRFCNDDLRSPEKTAIPRSQGYEFLLQPAGLREDLIRFYDYFGYTLGEKYQWQMDHLSIELEFMYFLCFQEHNLSEDRLSYQLAQLDFSTRHLSNWIPNFQSTLKRISSDDLYTKIVVELSKFIESDIEWQLGTIDDL